MALTESFSQACGMFEFDITGPLFEQILLAFQQLKPLELSTPHLLEVKERPGVYGLEYQGQLVYVGKADDDARGRLLKHRRQLTGRIGISPDDVQFKCLHLAQTWDPFKPESHLISTLEPSWNKRGFGPNDPGRRRDHTGLREDHWHVKFPLDATFACGDVPAGQYDVLQLLREVAKNAPFWVRFQGNREGRDDDSIAEYEAAQSDFAKASVVVVPSANMSVKDLLLLAVAALPDPMAWQLTQLPSHILLYREVGGDYSRMIRLWPPA